LALTESIRGEFADHGIGVSAICPGLVNTNITMATRHVGVSDEAQENLRNRTRLAYERRNLGPDAVAKSIVRAVAHNSAVVPVGSEAHLARFAYRLWPGLVRRLGSIKPPSSLSR
jgi:short-subunit dehydrogenase